VKYRRNRVGKGDEQFRYWQKNRRLKRGKKKKIRRRRKKLGFEQEQEHYK
jgi:hypothetical protein